VSHHHFFGSSFYPYGITYYLLYYATLSYDDRLEAVTASHKSNLMYTYIQTIGVVSQAAGVRVGKFLPSFIPKLQGFCTIDKYDIINATPLFLHSYTNMHGMKQRWRQA
jgi:hypothetical protein